MLPPTRPVQPGPRRLRLPTRLSLRPSLKTGVSLGLVLPPRGPGPCLGTSVVIATGTVLGIKGVRPRCCSAPAVPGTPLPRVTRLQALGHEGDPRYLQKQ